jgi:hypothetical protein
LGSRHRPVPVPADKEGVRNPIYLRAFTFMIALALVAANWLILLPALPLIALVYTQIGKKEAMLTARFGDEYREYMKRTRRLIQKFRHQHSTLNSEGGPCEPNRSRPIA